MASAQLVAADPLNLHRMNKLLIDYGGQVLQDVLEKELMKKYPQCRTSNPKLPVNMHTVLSDPCVRKTLDNLPSNVFLIKYRQQLYPNNIASAQVAMHDFDITLKVIFLRNICTFRKKTSAWDKPQAHDTSTEALIGKLKQKRNACAHKATTVIPDTEFIKDFQEIVQILLKLSSKFSQQELESVKTVGGMSDEEKELLKTKIQHWYEDEIGKIEVKLDQFGGKLDDTNRKVDKLEEKVDQSNRKVDKLGKEVHEAIEKRNRQEYSPKRTSFLPKQMEQFVGREEELYEISKWSLEKETTILNLKAGPGYGKTQTAIAAGHSFMKNGGCFTFYVEVRENLPVECLSQSLLTQLERTPGTVKEVSSKNLDKHALLNKVAHMLKNTDDNILIIFDNIEHYFHDSNENDFFKLLARLCDVPTVRILTTSREKLDLPGIKVKTHDLPEFNYQESKLLLQTLCEKQMPSDLIENIVGHSGHLPLAIWLIASQINDDIDPNLLLQELQENPLQALEADVSNKEALLEKCIEVSYNRLREAEKLAFQKLCIFPHSFSKDAAIAILSTRSIDTKLAHNRALTKLANRSLVVKQENGRYYLHQFIAYFGIKKLGEETNTMRTSLHFACEQNYMEYYCQFVLDLADELVFKGDANTLCKYMADLPNVQIISLEMSKKVITDELSDNNSYSRLNKLSVAFTLFKLDCTMHLAFKDLSIIFKLVVICQICILVFNVPADQLDEMAQLLKSMQTSLSTSCEKSLHAFVLALIKCVKREEYQEDILSHLEVGFSHLNSVMEPECSSDTIALAHLSIRTLYAIVTACANKEVIVMFIEKELKTLISQKNIDLRESGYASQIQQFESKHHNPRTILLLNAFLISLHGRNSKHRLIGSCHLIIGAILLQHGAYKQAMMAYEKVLALQKPFGEDPFTAACLNSIGQLYHAQNDITSALEFHMRAARLMDELGVGTGKVTIYCNIATDLRGQGDYDGSLHWLDKASEVLEKALGENEKMAALIYFSKSLVLEEKGYLNDALEFCNKALAIQENRLGEHVETARSYFQKGVIFQKQFMLEDAHKYYQKALGIYTKVYGEHSQTVRCYRSIASLLCDQGNMTEAKQYYRKALDMMQQVPLNRDLAMVYFNYAIVLHRLWDLDAALKSHQIALEMREKMLGEHEHTASSYYQKGRVLFDKGDLTGALDPFIRSLAIQEKLLGEHVDTASSSFNVGVIFYSKSKNDAAIQAFRRSFNICYKRKDMYSKEITASSLHYIGNIRCLRARYTKALDAYSKSLNVLEKLPVDKKLHRFTYKSRLKINIGCIHVMNGENKYSLAAEAWREAMEICIGDGDREMAQQLKMWMEKLDKNPREIKDILKQTKPF